MKLIQSRENAFKIAKFLNIPVRLVSDNCPEDISGDHEFWMDKILLGKDWVRWGNFYDWLENKNGGGMQ